MFRLPQRISANRYFGAQAIYEPPLPPLLTAAEPINKTKNPPTHPNTQE
jgi:hypothetical protein